MSGRGRRALGVDVGTRRVGVAVSDSAGTLATPIDVLDRRAGDEATWLALAEIAREWEVGLVVVGLPRSLDGSEGPAAAAARADAGAIGDATGLPVEFVDERFTTVTAAAQLQAAGVSGRARRGTVDAAAATVLLQAWLDGRRATAP